MSPKYRPRRVNRRCCGPGGARQKACMAAAERGGFQVGISFEPFFPQGEFNDVLDRIGWGGSLDAFYRIPNTDLHIGTTFAYHVYGWDTRWEPLSVYIPDVLVKVRTTNAVIRGHLLLRLQPAWGAARPYIEGLLGLQHLTTDTRAKRHINPWNYPVPVHTYEEYEDEFRDKMVEAGLPVDKAPEAKPVEEEAPVEDESPAEEEKKE